MFNPRLLSKYSFLALTLILLCAGCSGPGAPADNPASPAMREAESSHMLLDYVRVVPDIENLAMDVELLRSVAAHYNVKGFLTPPNCYGCIEFVVHSFNPITRIMDVDTILKNPTNLTGYDVRGILIANNTGHDIVNADDYTKLYDDSDPKDINPFIAFETNDYQRAFNSYETDTQQVLFRLPKPMNWGGFDYAVDASWPGHCKEPYEIIDFDQDGAIAKLFDAATLSVTVHDWQDDVSEVTIDATEIMGEVISLANTSGDTWSGELVNNMLPEPGVYRVLISAYSPNAPGWWLYDYADILVSEPEYLDRITFVSDRTGNEDIFMMNPDGTDVTQLTFDTSSDISPDFSHTERKILFTSDRDAQPGPPHVECELYVYDIDSPAVEKITDECEALDPDWSPSGLAIFDSHFAECLDIILFHMAYKPVDGGPTLDVPPQSYYITDYYYPEFRGDEAKLLFTGSGIGVFIYEVDYPSWENLKQISTFGSEINGTYSPDGTKVAYSSTRENDTDIYVMDLVAEEETRLTYFPEVDVQPTWSPDGTMVAFTHYLNDMGAESDIYVVSVDGEFWYNLTKEPDYADNEPDWSGNIF